MSDRGDDRRITDRPSARDRTLIILLGTHLLVWAAVVLCMPPASLHGDIGRFAQIAASPGIPYRDFAVEFPPLQTLVIDVLLRAELLQVAIRVALLSIASQLAIVWMLGKWWGGSTAQRFLVFALPLQVFMPFRLDYLSVAIALAGVVALRQTRAIQGGLFLGAATWVKLWPAAVAALVMRSGRALTSFVVALVVGALAWAGIAGMTGFRQVATFRGSDGWHIESSVGSIWWLIADSPLRVEGGTLRIGFMPGWTLYALGILALMVVAWTARRARAMPVETTAGLPAVVVVASLIALSPVSSPQYLAWLVPWCAIATRQGWRALEALMLSAGVLAAGSFIVYWELAGSVDDLRVASVMRSIVVASIALVASRALGVRPAGAERPVERSPDEPEVRATRP